MTRRAADLRVGGPLAWSVVEVSRNQFPTGIDWMRKSCARALSTTAGDSGARSRVRLWALARILTASSPPV